MRVAIPSNPSENLALGASVRLRSNCSSLSAAEDFETLTRSRNMLITEDMQQIIDVVGRHARQQGFILQEEIRAALARAGMPEAQWLDVVSLAGDMLTPRNGRYYYYSATALPSDSVQRRQRRLHRAVRRVINTYRSSARDERCPRGRFDIVGPVLVETEDGRCVTLLTSNLSTTGILLIGPKSLLGQKLRVSLVNDNSSTPLCLLVRIVWSSQVSEGLCENGGMFLGVAPSRRACCLDVRHAM
jgi:hypothetical protein